ncbi:hypothetical protein B0T18DRAFT_206601 [Schizothecium vesticola]|uniref:Hook C-terminal domain-containing protein n=1 Tax=Schizothecium vesticola TaxID=314040 RepID=A0AA40JYP5_9PEZI|nr:hypothetical protein B0T18DRAFT_206601 [Schizothecium vesticola]
MTGQEDKAFIAIRNALLDAQKELDLARARVQELERAIADKDRELLRIKTDISALGQEQAAALGAIKATDELLSESLTTELAATRRQLHQKTVEVNAIKDQLMATLLSKDKIRKDLDEAVAATLGQVVSDEPAKGKKDDTDKSEKIEKLREALRKKVEQLEKAEQEKYELQRRVKAAESGSVNAAQKAEHDQRVKTLERENTLITTAWYDITSRLQSNHVVLQRRQDAPKSWLNKQRQMVNATPRR